MKKIAFSGTLDPITNGHMWVIGEARAMAEEVTVFLSENPAKMPQFPAEERKRIIEQSAAERGWSNVRVVIVRGDYTARAAKRHGIDYLIRGIRNTADFDYENLIQQTNVDVLHGAKTIFVMPPRDLGSVSSSFVRGLQGPVGWHWSVQKFMPRPAYQAWIRDWLRKEWAALWHGPAAGVEAIANADRWFDRLTGPDAYGGATRHYHNLDHLVHGLAEIRVWAANAGAPQRDADLVKKAFWFHDAVYDHGPQEVSNEEASARLWLTSGLAADAAEADDVAALIRVTDHFQAPSIGHRLKDVMLGADLAILGQEDDVYDAYAGMIRREYGHVPDAVYDEHRLQALEHLRGKAEGNALYADAHFAAQYTERAIANLEREIASIGRAACG
ncbi:MAG TPA: pantetheine-phosphate adenylyltransferase [Paucimonas sp.]|nr:pantetheine-phosphate adenylyltransferase [Paucimonas sp.]